MGNAAIPPALALALALAGASCVPPPRAASNPLPVQQARPDPFDLVAMRQSGMRMMITTMAALGRAAEDPGAPVTRAAYSVGALQRFAQVLPTLYRGDTAAVVNTGALPLIWEDGPGFSARAGEFQRSVEAMAAAAKADDRAAFAQALESTQAACKACHDSYRAEEE